MNGEASRTGKKQNNRKRFLIINALRKFTPEKFCKFAPMHPYGIVKD